MQVVIHKHALPASILSALLTLIAACQKPPGNGYSANGKELALDQKYAGFPALPASRSAFEAALSGAGLRFELRTTNLTPDRPLPCPAPLRAPEDVRRKVDKCLWISGEPSIDFAERYAAFIDSGDSVIFVENWYEYTGP